MLRVLNLTNNEHKDELKSMISSYYNEVYNDDLDDSVISKLDGKKASIFRNFIIKDIKRSSSLKAERDINNTMSLLFDNSYNNDEMHNQKSMALGLYDDEVLIGYIILSVHSQYKFDGNYDVYGELHSIYLKDEYKYLFKNKEFMENIRSYVEAFFKVSNVRDVLARITPEEESLVTVARELGFVKQNIVHGNYYTKDIWQKTIKKD